ncbi:hypothetical protein CABS01_16501 [Colletotrichum abscissum]|uniref:uncharacterized protein n=1 Tax=Colletotrichum abscissum TaxID=1671311 RepID=UPI0027D7481F|nr:uncharacterized protein CABS01_16501 [Colletotrichum abscissum]KAK1521597.1 hypothetical protein CABS01_16501 [Colletotrichum abscissum]
MNGTVTPSTSNDPAVDVTNNDEHSRETTHDNDPLPTHKLEHLKVGANGVQLLVSTKNHLYDAEDVEGGNSSFQCVEAWSEGTDDGLLSTRFWFIYDDSIEGMWRV